MHTAQLPKGWHLVRSNPEVETHVVSFQTDLESIAQVATLTSLTIAGTTDTGSLMQLCSAHKLRNSCVQFSGELKTKDVAQRAGLIMQVLGIDEAELLSDSMQNSPMTGTSPWQHVQIIVQLSSAAVYLRFGVYLDGTGEVEFKNLKIKELDLGENLAVTMIQDNQNFGTRKLPEHPENLDFCDSLNFWRPLASPDSAVVTGVEIDAGFANGFLEAVNSLKEPVGFAQTIDAVTFRGKRIKFSGSLRCRNVMGIAGLFLRANAAPPRCNTLCFDDMYDRGLTGSAEWIEAAVIVDIPVDADTVTFGACLTKSGKIQFGRLQLMEVGLDFPKTDNYSRVECAEPSNLALIL